jgi:ParB family chromosome partitioning protein
MFEEARSFRDMMKARGITQNKLADFLGVSQPYIANKLRLLYFTKEQEERITELKLSERHARTILRLKDNEQRDKAISKCAERRLTVAMLEAAVDGMLCDSVAAVGEGYGAREKISDFKDRLDSSLSLLRSFGIRARAKTDESESDLYLTIHIEK